MESNDTDLHLGSCTREALFAQLAQADARPLVLCASARQAQALLAAFAASRIAAGAVVWETPEVLPFDVWRDRHLDTADAEPLPAPLSAAESRVLWRLAVDATREQQPLLRAGEAAQLAADAWQLCHEYRLRLPLDAQGAADVERFNQWAADYRRQLDRLGVLDVALYEPQLLDRLRDGAFALPAAVVLVGFDEPTPRIVDWCAALQARGVAVQRLDDAGDAQTPQLAVADDQELELRAAAQWALAQTRDDPQRRVAVVVPDLRARREAVQRIFDELLCPQFDAPEVHSPARPYNLTLGMPLAEAGLVQTALHLLQLASTGLDAAALGALLCSSDWGDADDHLDGAVLDARLRRDGHAPLDLAALQRLAPPRLQARWQPLLDALPTRRQTPDEWNEAITRFLELAGWPGARAIDSEEFQVLARWQELLADFARLERVLGRIPLSAAVGALRELAERTLFQPQSGDTRVQVMGVLEAQGLSFDALWVTGLDDEGFPAASRPHPFIPHALQRARRLPHASAERELAYAQAQLDGWRRRSGRLVLSHARSADGNERAPSPLLAPWLDQLESPTVARLPLAWEALAATAQLERVEDAYGPPPREGEVLRGGTGVLGNQARCPFRGFALHRLQLRPLEAPAHGLQAYDRGNLVHEVLERLWSSWREQSALLAQDDEALQQQIADAVDAALEHLQARAPQRLRATMRALEAQRLVALVTAWLAVERERAPFTVLRLESRAPGAAEADETLTTFEGLALRLRADRIDVDADGRRIVLDYKTGARKAAPWTDGRPEDPQLLLYALSEPQIAALSFARLTVGDIGLQGIARDDGFGPGIVAYTDDKLTRDAESWDALLGRWRGELASVAAEVRQGWAAVAPKHPRQSCRDCGLHAICRIREQVSLDEGEEVAT
ncbi:PD-(D/E)XK nuclease family protein [Solimonas marina]|uniref:PD-(D/E)XK nuclease family protein n=1 Tax=Solimonas marina TaxID=2714601 RepID=UPI0019D0EF10|nr:PD-(D/E)XK nuclease family protein [Solimonas marina]